MLLFSFLYGIDEFINFYLNNYSYNQFKFCARTLIFGFVQNFELIVRLIVQAYRTPKHNFWTVCTKPIFWVVQIIVHFASETSLMAQWWAGRPRYHGTAFQFRNLILEHFNCHLLTVSRAPTEAWQAGGTGGCGSCCIWGRPLHPPQPHNQQ